MTQVLVQVENLSKWYPIHTGLFRKVSGHVEALTDVSFTINEGQVVGVIGESGSGKSTLARTLVRLTEPTTGRVVIQGQDITCLSQKQLAPLRKGFQIVFQNPAESLNRRKTVIDTLSEVLTFHHIITGNKEQEEYCRELLRKVGLEARLLFRYPHELSIGQLARVALARALCTNPFLLVLDEIVSPLDISVQAQVLNVLLELCRESKIGYLFIAHDLAVVRHLADTVLVMYQGRVVEQGSADAIFENPEHPYTKLLLSSALPTTPVKRIL